MSVKERIRKFKLRPDRADVILPGAIVLQIIAREARVRQVIIPHVGLKDGLLLEMAEGAQTRAQACAAPRAGLGIGAAFGEEISIRCRSRASLTAKLAKQLFDQTRALHNLGDEDRLLLEVAALLHDIGHFINTIDHDKHGYYILKANRLIGLNDHQQEMVASLVRYHRKSFPRSRTRISRLCRRRTA